MALANINDATFYYEQHGEGEALILIGGYASHSKNWTPILDFLQSHFRVTLFDNRASGQTKDNGQTLSLELMAKDTIDLIEHLNIDKPHILGHSMGGTIAQTIAHLYPTKVNKLILSATSAKWRQAMLHAFSATIELRQKDIPLELIYKTVLPWLFGENFMLKSDLDEITKLSIEDPYMQTMADQIRQYELLKHFDSREYLKNIQSPTLILYGAEDIISLNDEAIFIHNNIDNAKIKKIFCGHAIPLEAPREMADNIIKFLTS